MLTAILSLEQDMTTDEVEQRFGALADIHWDARRTEAKFTELNSQYAYFDTSNEKAFSLFQKLAIACRSMIELIENNNTPDDTMAYKYAYRLMVLFVDDIHQKSVEEWFDTISKNADKLTNTFEQGSTHPYHDALLIRLNELPPAHAIQDRLGWMKLVQQKNVGVRAFPYLAIANKIEEKNECRAPSTLEQAKEIAARCKYSRIDEDKEFGILCNQYKISEKRFNKCLEYIQSGWPKKEEDSIPKLIITHKKFTWSKLPVTDKCALILGDITDCCQSLGGHSDQCVKDATSLSDNGLYILQDGKKIIGQAYLWRSKTGNICLDSIECLNNSISGSELHILLTEFAQKLLNKHSDIKRVTIGTGGKTPKNLFPKISIVETMRQGTLYGDAKNQYCIARTIIPLTAAQQEAKSKLLESSSQTTCDCLDYFLEHVVDTTNIIDELHRILAKNNQFRLTPQFTKLFLQILSNPELSAFEDIGRALEASKNSVRDVIKTMDELIQLFQCLNPKQGAIVLNALENTIPHLIQTTGDLNYVLKHFTPEQCTIVLIALKNQIPNLVKKTSDLIDLFDSLNDEQRTIVLMALKDKLPTLVRDTIDLNKVFRCLTPEQCTVVLNELEEQTPLLIKTADDLENVVWGFEPGKRITIINSLSHLVNNTTNAPELTVESNKTMKNKLLDIKNPDSMEDNTSAKAPYKV
jgi:hypothetical protein